MFWHEKMLKVLCVCKLHTCHPVIAECLKKMLLALEIKKLVVFSVMYRVLLEPTSSRQGLILQISGMDLTPLVHF